MLDYDSQRKRIYDICAHEGDDYVKFHGAMGTPVYQTSLFVDIGADREKAYHYSRSSNPTFEVAEEKLAQMENAGGAILTSSGMAAISIAMISCVKNGGHVITLNNVYGGTKSQLTYLERMNIETSYVRGVCIDDFEKAVKPNTQLIYLESPTTFMFELQDLKEIADFARQRGIKTMIDNTWATPFFQNPLDFGIDIVVHSVSKYLGGHSDLIGGAVAASQDIIDDMRKTERLNFGCQMDPHQAWMVVRSLRSFPVRMEKHMENGMKIAEFLNAHPLVAEVKYPGLPGYPQKDLAEKQMYGYSSLFSFVTKGTDEQARAFVKNVKIFNRAPSWGGYDSLLTGVGLYRSAANREATSKDAASKAASSGSVAGGNAAGRDAAHRNAVTPGLIRIAVGLESPESLMEALDDGLKTHII